MILVLRIKWFILRVLWKGYCHKFEVYCCLMCNWKEHHRAYAISNETTEIWIWCSDSEKRFKEEKNSRWRGYLYVRKCNFQNSWSVKSVLSQKHLFWYTWAISHILFNLISDIFHFKTLTIIPYVVMSSFLIFSSLQRWWWNYFCSV